MGNWWDQLEKAPAPPVPQAAPQPQQPPGFHAAGQPVGPNYEMMAQTGYTNQADDDMQMREWVMNGKIAPATVNDTPAYVGARAFQKKLAEDEARMKATQRGIKPLMDQLDEVEEAMVRSGRTVASKAIGPAYGPGLDTSGQYYQNFRALIGGSDDDKAATLNNKLHHLKLAVAGLFESIPGAAAGGSTDATKKRVEEMVQAAINSRSPEAFFDIIHDARNAIRGLGGQEKLPRPQSFTPDSWLPPEQRRQQQAPQPQGGGSVAGLPAGWSIKRVD